jgi:phage terminase large subunit GpA-like protein
VSEWADEKFYLSPESAAEPGRWKCMPYQVGILDAFSDPLVESVAWMKSARVGYTKCVDIVIGYHIEYDPCPISVVQPTIEDAEGFSKEELAPMIRDVPVCAASCPTQRQRTAATPFITRRFPAGASRSSARTAPRIPACVASRHALRRSRRLPGECRHRRRSDQAGHPPHRVLLEPQDRLWQHADDRRPQPHREALRSRRSARYYVPCPHCGYMDYLVFSRTATRMRSSRAGISWRGRKTSPRTRTSSAAIAAAHIEHTHKRDMVTAGEWRAAKPFTGHASFHIWAAYSFSPNASWGQIAREFVAAKEGHESLKTFVNTVLGETWKEKGDAPDWQRLYDRREEYPQGRARSACCFSRAESTSRKIG